MTAVPPLERDRPGTDPRLATRRDPPGTPPAVLAGIEPAPEVAPLVARLAPTCTHQSRAYAYFMEAHSLHRVAEHATRAKALYHVVLACPHANAGQRYWSAQRLSTLYRSSGDCARARAAWERYEALAGERMQPSRPFKACP